MKYLATVCVGNGQIHSEMSAREVGWYRQVGVGVCREAERQIGSIRYCLPERVLSIFAVQITAE